MVKIPLSHLIAFTLVLSATTATANETKDSGSAANSFAEALAQGVPYLDVRYRYESVDQDGFTKNANAHTVRTKVGYKTGMYENFSGTIEFENISGIGHENYNSGVNSHTNSPAVTDPEGNNINLFSLTYQGLPDTQTTLGRQFINLNNQRFVGSVGWRQDDQTFDALTITNKSIPDTTLYYGYANQVNRITGSNSTTGAWEGNMHFLSGQYDAKEYGQFTVYDYLTNLNDSPASSLAILGGRYDLKTSLQEGLDGLLALEYANEKDHGPNTGNFNLDYFLAEPGVAWKGITAKLGYESLEGNGITAFQTPLATLHAFNGWADKFTTTPVNGLKDQYVSVGYKLPTTDVWNGTNFQVTYHVYDAENGGANYGSEWNASVSQTFYKHYTAMIKYADYNADTFATDTQKLWASLQVKF
jgi:hypothetical protein